MYCCSWRPDPQAPFQTPSHLKEAVQEFERSQVPGMGLRPGTNPPASTNQDQEISEDLEFTYSYVHACIHTMYMYMYMYICIVYDTFMYMYMYNMKIKAIHM